jgi:hypothetical protein
MKSNWLKMYDKFGLILRVETVINSPKEFWVYRTQHHRDGTSSVGYYPMTKGVASLDDYQEQALACNRRYLDALAVVNDPAPAYPELRQLTEPKAVDGRSYAGFNPARRDDVRLFRARRRPHRAWLSQRRHPGPAVRPAEASGPTTACQRGGGATAETSPRAPVGVEDPANAAVASHGTGPASAGRGRATLRLLLATTCSIADSYYAENFSASCREVQR